MRPAPMSLLSFLLVTLLSTGGCGTGGGDETGLPDSSVVPDGAGEALADDAIDGDIAVAPDGRIEPLPDVTRGGDPDAGPGPDGFEKPEMLSTPDAPVGPDVQETASPAEELVEEVAAELPPAGPMDPGEAGSMGVSSAAFDLQVGEGWGATKLPLSIRLPVPAGAYPVVVFHHGFQLSPSDYLSYGAHLASWGYVVVMPKMPSGTFGFGAPTHVELKDYLAAVIDWVEDDSAKGAGGVLQGKANPALLGLAGHSMGGKISLLLATEDKRPLAVFALDPVDAAGGPLPVSPADYPSVTPELMGKILVPIGLVGETLNGTCTGFMCQPCAPEADNFHQYFLHAAGPALEIEILGAGHMSFLDNPSCGLVCSVCPAGTDDTAVTRKLSRRYMTAFFNVRLKKHAEYAPFLTGADMDQDVAAGLVSTSEKNGF